MVAATHFNYSVPGSWNDADMLWTCTYGGTHPQNHMKMSEYRVHQSVWSIFGSPMILSADVRTVATQYPPGFEDCMSLLLNKAIVDVNQDNATLPARLVSQHATTDPVTSSSITGQVFARNLTGGKIAVLLLNRGSKPTTMNVTWAELQAMPVLPQRATVFDVMKQVDAGSASGAFSAVVPPHDVSYVVLSFRAHHPGTMR
jgi:alpha-galactosidase